MIRKRARLSLSKSFIAEIFLSPTPMGGGEGLPDRARAFIIKLTARYKKGSVSFDQPPTTESVSKAVSEPGAVATGSQNQAELQDPVATAPGSDTVSTAGGSDLNVAPASFYRGPRHN